MDSAHLSAPLPDPEPPITPELLGALSLLLQARDFARQLGCDPWQFAVEMLCLCSGGLTHSYLRWLLGAGYAEHGVESTAPGATQRAFRPVSSLALPEGACFVLTERGAELARRLQRPAGPPGPAAPAPALPQVAPHWDKVLRELRCGEVLVKAFRRPAPNQELVLEAFEEERWPAQIDDPLPGSFECDPRQRLHDTIIRLNRNQRHRLVLFRGDGSGKGIRWEWLRHGRTLDAPDPHHIVT
jgi:hypothetical protein